MEHIVFGHRRRHTAGRLAPRFLLDCVATRRMSEAELRAVDPHLDTLKNLNRPEDYLAALAEAGFTAPPEVLEPLTAREARTNECS